jgi:hypothetical protein
MARDAHSAAKAVDMLDLLIEFFDDRRTLDQRQVGPGTLEFRDTLREPDILSIT